MRHGDAVSAAQDPRRPLSLQGRRQVEQAARLALQHEIRVATIFHSGILRAQETAEILAKTIVPERGVAAIGGLLPEDDPVLLQAELAEATESMALVGHLPFLGRLAALLVSGDSELPITEFFPATMVGFSRTAKRWKIEWRIAP